jgi:hypothetical protein
MELQKLKDQLLQLEAEKKTMEETIDTNRKIQEQNVANLNFKIGQIEMLKSLIAESEK